MGLIGNLNVTGYEFFYFFYYAINNAYLLYKHSCHAHKLCVKDLLGFRLELVHLLLEQAGPKIGVVRAHKVARDAAQSARVCELDRVSNIIDLKSGRCHYCQIKKKKPQHYTSFGCTVCHVRLCKTPCFVKFHSQLHFTIELLPHLVLLWNFIVNDILLLNY